MDDSREYLLVEATTRSPPQFKWVAAYSLLLISTFVSIYFDIRSADLPYLSTKMNRHVLMYDSLIKWILDRYIQANIFLF